jgi:hypothetical protein
MKATVALSLLYLGLQKLFAYPAFAAGLASGFADTWLPVGLAEAVLLALPFLEVGTALLLLSNWYRKHAVVAAAGVFLVLQFGNLVLGETSTAVENVIYVAVLALALHTESE